MSVAAKKDKEKVFGGDWSLEHINYFLELKDPDGVNNDFHCIIEAYKHMPVEGFEAFLIRFKEAGRDLEGKGTQGKTAKELILSHKASGAYAELF